MVQTHTAQATVSVAARSSTVYKFLTDPQRFQRWMGPGSSIGGQPGAAVTLRYPNGDVASGEVADLKPNERVAFTYGYQGGARFAPGTTRITFELREHANGTSVALNHDGLPSQDEVRNHLMGWRHFLGMLAVAAAQEELGEVAPAAVAAYVQAWNETDVATRAGLIERCWEPSATLRDPMSYVEGRDNLNAQISTAQMFAPGAQFEQNGQVDQCQGAVRFGWKIQMGGGTMTSGVCFGQLSLAGRFTSVVSFWDAQPGAPDVKS
jgi:uncharacterized protein YndB with AHSA1/START domain